MARSKSALVPTPAPAPDITGVTTAALAEARGALKLVEDHPCRNPEDIALLTEWARDVQTAIKLLEEERTRLTADKVAALEADRLLFREPLKLLEKAKTIGLKKIDDAKAALKAKAQAALDNHDVPTAIASIPKQVEGASTSKRMAYEILCVADVPERFKMVNHSALQRAIEEGEHEIPGVRVYPSEKTQVRRR